MEEKNIPTTFWDHLEELRSTLVRMACAAIGAALLAFLGHKWVFQFMLAPSKDDFIFYRALHWISQKTGVADIAPDRFDIQLISTELSSQFMLSMTVSLYVGLLAISPYMLYEIFRYISPALYANERKYSKQLVGYAYLLFMLGLALNYLLIFPLTFRFLGTFQVNEQIETLISLKSYIDTMTTLSLLLGLSFEIPILGWLFAKLGLLTSALMRDHRRHALVGLVIVAAIITPSHDIFTLLLVATPIYLLYEISILVVKRQEKRRDLLL